MKLLLIASMITLSLAADARSNARAIGSLSRAEEWLGINPVRYEELEGKVVLVDFWTYTCVNWLRTAPYLRAWHEKYRDSGLVVVGVHSPEFGFEKEPDNVRDAVRRLRIDYPVAVDSHLRIWRAYDNQYWPAVYLVDRKGQVRFRHFGEGDYASVERVIQQLLAEDGRRGVPSDLVQVDAQGAEAPADWNNVRSPENYVGYLRTAGFSSPEPVAKARPATYSIPADLRPNSWALSGEWMLSSDAIRLNRPNGRIAYRFHARDVNLVIRPPSPGQPVRFRVLLDGKPPGAMHGSDIDASGNGIAREPRLYQLIRQTGRIDDRQVEIEFLDADIEAYSFTFG